MGGPLLGVDRGRVRNERSDPTQRTPPSHHPREGAVPCMRATASRTSRIGCSRSPPPRLVGPSGARRADETEDDVFGECVRVPVNGQAIQSPGDTKLVFHLEAGRPCRDGPEPGRVGDLRPRKCQANATVDLVHGRDDQNRFVGQDRDSRRIDVREISRLTLGIERPQQCVLEGTYPQRSGPSLSRLSSNSTSSHAPILPPCGSSRTDARTEGGLEVREQSFGAPRPPVP
jgi:hypothetical protein